MQVLAGLDEVGASFSEDCLTLNIWSKPQTGEKYKAVLFWIFGGGTGLFPCSEAMLNLWPGFEYGTANSMIYNGQHFADNEDVIVVTAKSVYEQFTTNLELIWWT